MADLDTLLDALARIQTEGTQSFAIVAVGEAHYAQFTALDPGVWAEVVGNAYLPPAHQLMAEQQAEMRARGWAGDGEENWRRDYPASLDLAGRQRMLHDALDALEEVYHATGAIRLDQVVIPGAPASSAAPTDETPPASARLVIVIAAALLALGVAVAVAVFSAGG